MCYFLVSILSTRQQLFDLAVFSPRWVAVPSYRASSARGLELGIFWFSNCELYRPNHATPSIWYVYCSNIHVGSFVRRLVLIDLQQWFTRMLKCLYAYALNLTNMIRQGCHIGTRRDWNGLRYAFSEDLTLNLSDAGLLPNLC